MTGATADQRARLATAWESARLGPGGHAQVIRDRAAATLWARAHPSSRERPRPAERPLLVERLVDAPCPPGWCVWRVGGEGGALTMLPSLAASASLDLHRRHLLRVIANCTGQCPECSAAAGLPSIDPEQAPAGWRMVPVTVGIVHAPGCQATFTEADRPHLDPRALGGSGSGGP